MPSTITGAIAIVSLVTNYRSSKRNQLQNMIFTQKEKVADQFIEKSAELMALTDPLALNTKINEYTPATISHEAYMGIMQDVLSIGDRTQKLGTTIKLYTWSVYEQDTLKEVNALFSAIDKVQELVQDMTLELCRLHLSNTEEGRFVKAQPMMDKKQLEQSFSIKYKEPYIEMSFQIITVARLLREEALNVVDRKKQMSKP